MAGFSGFEDQMIDITKASMEKGNSEDEMRDPWIEMRLNAAGELEVMVMPNFKGCIESSGN